MSPPSSGQRASSGCIRRAWMPCESCWSGRAPCAPSRSPIPVRGADPTERLVRFLGDVLYLYDTERVVPDRVSPAGISGEPFDPVRHHALREVKAVTYHGAAVLRDGAGYRATIVFDV